jgi:hypothetical protein
MNEEIEIRKLLTGNGTVEMINLSTFYNRGNARKSAEENRRWAETTLYAVQIGLYSHIVHTENKF